MNNFLRIIKIFFINSYYKEVQPGGVNLFCFIVLYDVINNKVELFWGCIVQPLVETDQSAIIGAVVGLAPTFVS
jgi:hypothetical protein